MEKTILKYLKEHEVPYSNRKISYEITRNSVDQYTFKTDVNKCSENSSQSMSDMKGKARTISTQQSSCQCKDQRHQNKKSAGYVKNLTEFSKKYKNFFSGISQL